jgi:Endonuclease/Exonuclease/phosphatase family
MLPKPTNNSTVMFWNVWGHRCPGELHKHIASQMPTTDVFCFTEVTMMGKTYRPTPVVYTSKNEKEPPTHLNGVDQLMDLMHRQYMTMYNSPKTKTWVCQMTGKQYHFVGFGSALIYRRNLAVVDTGKTLICKNFPEIGPQVLQWIVYQKGVVSYLVAHLHGVWIAENTKGDHEARLAQSREVRVKLESLMYNYRVDKVVFGGDLNLDLYTRSLEALLCGPGSTVDYRNLIVEHEIASTRTPLYRKYGMNSETMYADYAIVSPKVEVHRFEVPNHVWASDHAPLLVEFS